MAENQTTDLIDKLNEDCRAKAAEIRVLREALRRARYHSVASTMFHGGEAASLARWIDAGMAGPLPEITSPIVLKDMPRGR